MSLLTVEIHCCEITVSFCQMFDLYHQCTSYSCTTIPPKAETKLKICRAFVKGLSKFCAGKRKKGIPENGNTLYHTVFNSK